MIRLRTLGSVELRAPDNRVLDAVLAQPKRVALLIYLAAARPAGFHRRDRLLALFWPELDESRARDALNQALRFLRQSLGSDVLTTRGTDEVGVDAERVWCDAVAFRAAVDRGQPAEALELYHGDFLNGFFAEEASGFAEWVEGERAALRELGARGARQLAELHDGQGAHTVALGWGRKAVDLAPDDERAFRRLLGLLERAGDRAGAMEAYDDFAHRLRAEYGAVPAAETRAIIDRMRQASRMPAVAVATPPEERVLPPDIHPERHEPEAEVFDSLAPGASLANGRYIVEGMLGAGGMATVYVAHDVRHDRDVAIKVLHRDLGAALGGDRFLAEIRTTARLQHPHILPLLDSGTADGLLYYVMPLVTGETLRARLDRERQLSIGDAIRIARDVASALDYAHRHNVIHRDIKPENILLHDGSALVADFGIALAVQQAGGQRLTQTGLSLGTPSYMSPEQAIGERMIDARSDVYALGAVTYEMLAGEPPFTGPTAQAIIAKLMSTEPVLITSLRKAVPANVAVAVHAALEKLLADRCESAKAFADALQDTRLGVTAQAALTVHPAPSDGRSRVARYGAFGGWAAALITIAAAVWMWRQTQDAAQRPAVQLMLDAPNARPDLARFAVSGDGARFAFSTDEGIAYRDAGQREYRLLAGTEAGVSPSFSPDGDWIVYQANRRLRKIPVAGGSPIALFPTDSVSAGRVSWGEDGSIVFETGSVLAVIPPNGALRVLRKATAAQEPRLTPDGRGILYVDNRQRAKLMYYDLALDTAFTALEEAGEAQLLPTGHLIYGSPAGGIYTIRFNQARHAVEGSPSPVVRDVQPSPYSPFIVTRNGTLVYRAGVDAEYRTLIREPNGKVDTLPVAYKVLSWARFSPDGRLLALSIGSARGSNRHTALYNFDLGTLTRFTQEGGGHAPVWSPDGSRLAFTAEGPTTDAEDVFVQPVDRSTPAVAVLHMPRDQHASAWPSDTMLVVSSNLAARTLGGTVGGGNADIVNPAAKGPARPYLDAPWGESDASISPNGQWAAFTSLESGAPEIHVRRFPVADAGGRWKVSTGGGQRARWSGDGRTIYYQNAENTAIQSVRVRLGPTFAVGASETIMKVPAMGSAWDVDRASGRMVVTESVVPAGARIVVMQHWLEQFRRGPSSKR